MQSRHALALAAIAIFLSPVALFAQAPSAERRATWNVIDRIGLPPDQQDNWTKDIIEKLASSKVRTARDATEVMIGSPTGSVSSKRGLGGDEIVEVTGLFYVEGASLPSRGNRRPPELVWEVRFTTIGIYLKDVFWVMARTGEVLHVTPRP